MPAQTEIAGIADDVLRGLCIQWIDQKNRVRKLKVNLNYLQNKERILNQSRERYFGNLIFRRQQAREYYRANRTLILREKHRQHYSKTYGLTMALLNELVHKQGGCCAICGRHRDVLRTALFVDHDHESGAVRGLLCGQCNAALWALEHAEWRSKAEKYLATNRRPS